MKTRSAQSIGLVLLSGACCTTQAAWNAHGPDGGSVLAVDSGGSQLRIATSDGIYESSDGGANWSRLGDLPRGSWTSSVVSSPANPAIVMASASGQLYRSTDGGAHWIGTGLPIANIAFHPLVPGQAIASHLQKLSAYRTDDAGATWTPVTQSGNAITAASVAADPTQAGAFYASTQSRTVLRSSNGGWTWTTIQTDPTGTPFALSPDPYVSDGILWASNNLDVGRAIRFQRGTQTQSVVVGVDTSYNMLADPLTSGRFWYIGLVYPNSVLFESIDHGATFTQVGAIPGMISGFVLDADRATSGRLYGNDALGFAVSSDAGRTWQSRTHGVPLAQTNAVSIRPDVPAEMLAGGNAYGVALSVDGGDSWQISNSGLTQKHVNSLARSPLDPMIVYAGTDNGLFRSSDGGRQWNEVAAGSFPYAWRRFARLAFDTSDPSKLVGLHSGQSKPMWSDDGGVNWRDAQISTSDFDFRVIPRTGRGAQRVYALAWQTGWDHRLYRTVGHGDVFSPAADSRLVTTVAVDPNNENTLIAFARDGQFVNWNVYLSRDAGDHWQFRGSIPHTSYEPQVQFDPCDSRRVFALIGKQYFYVSPDLGATWVEESIAIPSQLVHDLDSACLAGSVSLAAATEYAGAQVRTAEFVDRIYIDGFEAN
jgi:photosystem II stability/assembly factor-like uncharacterized protein